MANLSATRVKNLKDAGRYGDGAGLYLSISKAGTRSWVQRIQVNRRRRDLGLGRYPDVTLAAARDRARENRQRVADGNDPIGGREFGKPEKPKTPKTPQQPTFPTFESEARAFHTENAGARWTNPKNVANWLNRAEKYWFPAIGNLPINKVDTVHLLDVLVLLQETKPETAKRLKVIARQVFGRSLARGLVKTNPADSLAYGLPPRGRAVSHMRALHYSDVADALERIDDSQAYEATKAAVRFMTLTATRGAETRGARWSEIDVDGRLWRIPAERMKQRREHVIPLSNQALAVLDAAREWSWSSEFVFPSMMNDGKPLSANTMAKLFKELEIGAVPHGLRTSFRVWAAECSSASWAAIELSLGHAVGNAVEQAYFRSDLLDQRRELLEQWADYLDGSGGVVQC